MSIHCHFMHGLDKMNWKEMISLMKKVDGKFDIEYFTIIKDEW